MEGGRGELESHTVELFSKGGGNSLKCIINTKYYRETIFFPLLNGMLLEKLNHNRLHGFKQ